MTNSSDQQCPCSSGRAYADCCQVLHRGQTTATTAERLMRSRYSAFALGKSDYVLATWHPSTRPENLELDPGLTWVRLEIIKSLRGSMFDTQGTVEFRAHYRAAGKSGSQHEVSEFRRVDNRWYYLAAT